MPLRFRRLWLLVLILPLAWSAPARADDRAEARQLFREGMTLIDQGRTEEGVTRLEAAYERLPHPAVLFNIGRAWAEAGELRRARPYLQSYLDSEPRDAEEVTDLLSSIDARLEAEGPAPGAVAVLPGEGAASPGELATLEDTATQLGAMADLTGSERLREQAQSLRQLARALRHRRVGGATPSSAVTRPDAEAASAAPVDAGRLLAAEDAELLMLEGASEIGLEIYEEQVVSASRFAQSTLDAPYSSSTVTAQDIRMSGITSIPELLRRVAGVDVMTLTPGDSQVSVRGLNQRLNNKVLVLVDGRSVYLDFLGATMWSALPVALEDITRIEVIRGPASALYGADAFTGMVNIITREPGEGGAVVSAGAGDAGQLRAVASVSGRNERGLGWRLGGGYQQAAAFSAYDDVERADLIIDQDLGLSRIWADGEIHQRFGRDWEVGAGGSVSNFSLTLQAISRLRELRADDGLFSQVWGRVGLPGGFTFQTFWNFMRADVRNVIEADGAIPIEADDIFSHMADAELIWARELDLGVPHRLVLGLGYRFKYIDWNWIGGHETEHHFSLFFEDEIALSDVARLGLSTRLDRHPLLDAIQVSPRASLVLRPTATTALRASAGTAFRSPTFMESYLRIANQTPYRAITAYGMGNRELEPEQMQSFEVGLTQHLGEFAALELNGYYNLLANQILLSTISPYRLADYPGYNPELGAHPVGELQFSNERATFRQMGGDFGVRTWPMRGLDLFASYALHETAPVDPDVVLGGRELDHRTPTHKVSGGLQYRSPLGLDVSLEGHWVGEQVWVEQTTDPETGVRFEPYPVDPYLLMNARVGMRLLNDGLDVGVVATNLLDHRHREHPFGQRIGRRLLGTATFRF